MQALATDSGRSNLLSRRHSPFALPERLSTRARLRPRKKLASTLKEEPPGRNGTVTLP